MADHTLNAFELGLVEQAWDALEVVTRSHAPDCECMLCEARVSCCYEEGDDTVRNVTFISPLVAETWTPKEIMDREA